MKTLKRVAAGALALAVLAVQLCLPVFAVQSDLPALPSNVCVVDDANVLSAETEDYITQLSGTLQSQCKGATIAVLTVQYTGAVSTEQFATDAFNTWGVGDAKENNGVLLLLVMESPNYVDGDYYIIIGTGLKDTALDKGLSSITQICTEPPFAQQDYDTAVIQTAGAVAESFGELYGVQIDVGGAQPAPDNNDGYNGGYYYEEEIDLGGSYMVSLIVDIIFFVLLFCLIVLPVGRGFGWGWGPFGWHWGPFGWFGPWWVGSRPWYHRPYHRPYHGPRGPHGPHGPHGPGGPLGGPGGYHHGGPRPGGPRPGGPRPPSNFGGMGGGSSRGGGMGRTGGFSGGGRSGGFSGGSRGGGFGGMGGGGSRGGGAGRGR